MSETVKVAIRLRPQKSTWVVKGTELTSVPPAPPASGSFDYVLDGSNLSVYHKVVQPLVMSAIKNCLNATIFAYGQTASGKTHTMMGTFSEEGIISLSVQDIFSYIKNSNDERNYLLRVSYLEIYNEVLLDLLSNQSNLAIHQDSSRGVIVTPLREEVVTSCNQVMEIIFKGERNRHIAATDFNLRSSRSHSIVQIIIEIEENSHVSTCCINLIDLAGSEKAAEEIERRKEGAYINKSLLTLATVISKLTDKKSTHVPFRDSKLTRILQPSLSGDARVAVLCTISPLLESFEETNSTIKTINDKALLQLYKIEIQKLKEQLQSQDQTNKYKQLLEVQENKQKDLQKRLEHLTNLILKSGESGSRVLSPGPYDVRPSCENEILLEDAMLRCEQMEITIKNLEKENKRLQHENKTLEEKISGVNGLENELRRLKNKIVILEAEVGIKNF